MSESSPNESICPQAGQKNLLFRPARMSDYSGAAELARQVHRIHAAARPDFFDAAFSGMTRGSFNRLLHRESTQVWVGEEGGRLLAYAVLCYRETEDSEGLMPRKLCNVEELCVEQSRRGEGIGRQFMTFLESAARENGSDTMELTVWKFNTGARAFYASLGMETRVEKLEKRL